jgi:hypothetical protein
LYEDDGVSYQYRKGIYSTTLFSFSKTASFFNFTMEPQKKEYATMRKTYQVCIHGLKEKPLSVQSSCSHEEHFDQDRGLLTLTLPDTGAGLTVKIEVKE